LKLNFEAGMIHLRVHPNLNAYYPSDQLPGPGLCKQRQSNVGLF
jgi:hypothetical protein